MCASEGRPTQGPQKKIDIVPVAGPNHPGTEEQHIKRNHFSDHKVQGSQLCLNFPSHRDSMDSG